MCFSLSQGLVSKLDFPCPTSGADPGSYQDLKIPPITDVKQNSQMPGIHGTMFVLSLVQNKDLTISKQASCSRECF